MSTDTTSGEGGERYPSVVLTPKQAMEALNVSKATLFALLRTGELPSVLLAPRTRRIRRADLDAYLERLRAEQKPGDHDETRQAS